MTRKPAQLVAVLLLSFLFVSAAAAQDQSPFDPREMRQIVNGVNASTAIRREEALRGALDSFGIPAPEPFNFGQWIAAIEAADRAGETNILGGLGGIASRSFLATARQMLSPSGNFVGGTLKITGQIEESVEFGSGNVEPGYYYDSDLQSGHLWVRMVVELRRTAGPPKKIAYRFKVAVTPGHFLVAQRDGTQSDVFPTARTMPIPASVAGDFQVKLWARGTGIVVERVERDMNYDAQRPKFSLLPPNNPNFATLYRTNDESCIDMMFLESPPQILPPGAAPPFYCLGRCDNPPIFNTM